MLVVELEDASPAQCRAVARLLLPVLTAADAEAIVGQASEDVLVHLGRRVLEASIAKVRRCVKRSSAARRTLAIERRVATTA